MEKPEITGTTTFQEIRDAFNNINQEDIKNDEFARKIKEIREPLSKNKSGKVGPFEFMIAVILGGTKGKQGTHDIYMKIVYKNVTDGSSATACANFLELGIKIINEELKDYLNEANAKKFTLNQLASPNFFDSSICPKICENYDRDKEKAMKEAVENFVESFGGKITPTATTNNNSQNTTEEKTVTDYIAKCIETSRKKNIIFTGAPGTGKTYSVEKYVNEQNSEQLDSICSYSSRYFKFVQFHGSYDYTDFVEGLRPIERGDQMVFVRMDGTFKALCREAAEAEQSAMDEEIEAPIYYFVIDEINRAELSKVFGELMYCFEKRGSEHKVQTQYHNLPTYGETENGIEKLDNDIFNDGFYVPENVVIIGTMNDIDRNVETFDFALRRRFDWIPIKANDFMETSLRSMLNDEKVSKDLAQRAIRMNEVISGESGKRFGLNEDYHIGPAYFKDYDKAKSMGENLDDIWKRNIESILREYLRGKNGVDKFINDCHKALMNDQSGDKDTNEPQTTAEDEE